jgi:hypothetical protein
MGLPIMSITACGQLKTSCAYRVAYVMHLNSRRPAPYSAIIVFFALYWVLLLPFICWGAWATPGHPHARPHLVFSPPMTAAHGMGGHLHGSMSMPNATQDLTKCEASEVRTADTVEQLVGAGFNSCEMMPGSSEVAGQSLPSTLATTVFVVVISASLKCDLAPNSMRERVQAPHFPCGFAVPVPTPPPRSA